MARNLQTTYGARQLFHWTRAAGLAEARAVELARHTWKVIASDMPLSIIVYDDAAQQEGARKRFAQGDGPPRGRELEIADILRFIKDVRRRQHGMADGGRALRRRALLQPGQAQFQEFDPFWEFVSGPLHAGTFGPNELDNTFWPRSAIHQGAPGSTNKTCRHPAGMQFFGHVQDRRRQRADDGDAA